MTDIAENLAMIGRKAYENASPWRVRKVIAVPSATKVSIDVGDGLAEDVPCLSSYRNRSVGDRVILMMTDERGWLVFGRIGAEDQLSPNQITPIPLPLPMPDPSFDVDPAPKVDQEEGPTDA